MTCWDRPRRSRLAVGALALLVPLAACSVKQNTSGGSTASGAPTGSFPDSAFQAANLTGSVVHADGSAAPGLPVTVTRLATNGEKAGDFLTALFTGGLACIPDNGDLCSATDTVVDQTTTGSDGSYATALDRAYVPGYQTDADWRVVVSSTPPAGAASGPTASYEMEVNTAAPVAPALPLWEATPIVSGSRLLTITLAAPPLPSGATPKQASTEFVDAQGASVLSLTAPSVDARLLEDVAVRVVGTRAVDVVAKHPDGSTTYHQHLLSSGVAYRGALVPASRGKPCALAAPVTGPCPLTDGDLVTAAAGPDATNGAATLALDATAIVDLGATVDIGLVVARGCSGCTIETSSDAATWAPLSPKAASAPGVTGLRIEAGDRPRPGRYVRVLHPAGLTEVSVWPADEQAAGRGGTGLVESDQKPHRGDDKFVAALVAMLLVGLVGGAVVGRRLRAR